MSLANVRDALAKELFTARVRGQEQEAARIRAAIEKGARNV